MTLTINKDYPCNPQNYQSKRNTSVIKYLIYHYTANKTDTAKNNCIYYQGVLERKASAHYFCDETPDTVWQSVEDNITAASVGGSKWDDIATTGGAKMYGIIKNANSISIEMCSTNGVIAEATLKNAVELGKYLMQKYNIPIDRVYRHFDVNGKHCPGWAGWYGADCSKWNDLKRRLGSSSTVTDVFVQAGAAATSAGSVSVDYNKNLPTGITLKKGSKGVNVGILQTALNKLISAGLDVDCDFGTKTYNAVVTFQKKYAAVCGNADGIVGTKTISAVNTLLNGGTIAETTQKTTANYNQNLPTGITLKTGSKGTNVGILQTALNKLINAGLTVDCNFGTKTKNAVVAFQNQYAAVCGSADGIVGAKTISAVNTLLNGGTINATPQAGSSTKTSAHIRDLQGAMNADGFRDENGNTLKEDGIAGGHTNAAAQKVMLSTKTMGKYINVTAWVQCRVGADPDGKYGNDTKNKVAAFQSAHGLSADGVTGPKTMLKLIEVWNV